MTFLKYDSRVRHSRTPWFTLKKAMATGCAANDDAIPASDSACSRGTAPLVAASPAIQPRSYQRAKCVSYAPASGDKRSSEKTRGRQSELPMVPPTTRRSNHSAASVDANAACHSLPLRGRFSEPQQNAPVATLIPQQVATRAAAFRAERGEHLVLRHLRRIQSRWLGLVQLLKDGRLQLRERPQQ